MVREWDIQGDYRLIEHPNGGWITKEDHIKAIREAEQRGWDRYREQHDGISERFFQQIRNDMLDTTESIIAAMPTAFWINTNTKEAQEHKRYVRDTILALKVTDAAETK